MTFGEFHRLLTPQGGWGRWEDAEVVVGPLPEDFWPLNNYVHVTDKGVKFITVTDVTN